MYLDFLNSTKKCSIYFVHSSDMFRLSRPKYDIFRLSRPNKKSVRVCLTQFRYISTFSTKFWYISTSSTQQKMFDFVRPSTDKCQFFRPSFAFGIFRLSRINKKCSILFDPVQICFNFLDQVLLLVYFDFLDSTKKSSIMFNPVQICFNFLDQVLVLV